jgi:hypothetical protein
MTSPNQPSSFGGSLFSFNPLSKISQGGISTNQQNQPPIPKPREDSPKGPGHHINSIRQLVGGNSDSEHEEEKRSSGLATKQGGTTDFYNAFKSASSLFSKPLFGATVSKGNTLISQPPVE